VNDLAHNNNPDFDIQAAWMRRFHADAASNLQAFALRLREAMPERVTIKEYKGLFSKPKIVGVLVEMDQQHFGLELANGRLQATLATVVRGIAISNKSLDPAEWFAKLAEETRKTSEHAKRLAQSLSAFMAG
jgi:hypothetical protein